jgi:hypothetical protein
MDSSRKRPERLFMSGDSLFTMRKDEPLARAAIDAIHRGDVEALTRLLDANPGLARSNRGEPNTCHADEMSRALLQLGRIR